MQFTTKARQNNIHQTILQIYKNENQQATYKQFKKIIIYLSSVLF